MRPKPSTGLSVDGYRSNVKRAPTPALGPATEELERRTEAHAVEVPPRGRERPHARGALEDPAKDLDPGLGGAQARDEVLGPGVGLAHGLREPEPRELERNVSSRKEPERKSASPAATQRELEDRKREKEERARKDRLWERQQAERKREKMQERRTVSSRTQVRYYRAGSNEPSRGARFTDAFR